jgi:hypothetical protein
MKKFFALIVLLAVCAGCPHHFVGHGHYGGGRIGQEIGRNVRHANRKGPEFFTPKYQAEKAHNERYSRSGWGRRR